MLKKDLVRLFALLKSEGMNKEALIVKDMIKDATNVIDLKKVRSPEQMMDIKQREEEKERKGLTEVVFLPDRKTWANEGYIALVDKEQYEKLKENNLTLDDLSIDRIVAIPSFDDAKKLT
jgi:hypothetical protein